MNGVREERSEDRERPDAPTGRATVGHVPDPPFYDEAPPQRPGDGDGDSGQPQQPPGEPAVRGGDAARGNRG